MLTPVRIEVVVLALEMDVVVLVGAKEDVEKTGDVSWYIVELRDVSVAEVMVAKVVVDEEALDVEVVASVDEVVSGEGEEWGDAEN